MEAGRGGGGGGGSGGGRREGYKELEKEKVRTTKSKHGAHTTKNLNRISDQARPATREDGELNFGTVSFVCSFVIIANWTLLQVILCF